jgi:Ca2+-binding RTX toxin-like protein
MTQTKALFTALDASNYDGLWVTDGTPAGTYELTVSGLANDGFQDDEDDFAFSASYGGNVYFIAQDATGADGLWQSNGTASGTVEITISGIDPSERSVSNLLPASNGIYFTARDAQNIDGLWFFNGSAEGATEVATNFDADNQTFGNLGTRIFISTTSVYIADGYQYLDPLYVSDGTVSGTTALPYLDSSSFFTYGGKEVFTATLATPGEARESLWISDGTAAGTGLLLSNFSNSGSGDYAVVGTKLLIVGNGMLLSSDGTAAGTTPISIRNVTVYGEGFEGLAIASVGTRAVLLVDDLNTAVANQTVFVTDGTSAGTVLLTPTGVTGALINPNNLTQLSPTKVLFTAQTLTGIEQLWVSDATSAGTTAITVPNAANDGFFDFTNFGSDVVFKGTDTAGNESLWITDGTSAGTKEITTNHALFGSSDVNPGTITAFQAAQASVSGPASILPGNGGADTVIAATGSSTVTTASNGALVFLGSGANSIVSGGSDTVVGGTGSATVSAGNASDLIFSIGGPLEFISGAGASTVVAGAVATTLFGGGGNTLAFTDGNTSYSGAVGTDTVVGLAGSLTVKGGSGGGLYFGGTAGKNVIQGGVGNVTAFGGGAGDVLSASGSASDLFAGGVGAETLTGAGSSGANTFFAGFGQQVLVGGSGNTALVAGAGADQMTGGSGLTLFLLVNGRTAGSADTISGFDPSHDFVKLAGYSGTTASMLAAATVANGSATISLSDGTSVTFAGLTQLNASSFT